jgi:hypothetical protein
LSYGEGKQITGIANKNTDGVLCRVIEEKTFNGISKLEGELMDSQAEIAHLALTNEAALKDAEDLQAAVKNLEKQLSDFMHDVDEKLCSPAEVVGRPYSPRLSTSSGENSFMVWFTHVLRV